MNPSFDQWAKTCSCETPLNPDLLYIKCDKCELWFHPECCNIKESDVEEIEVFYCKRCN